MRPIQANPEKKDKKEKLIKDGKKNSQPRGNQSRAGS